MLSLQAESAVESEKEEEKINQKRESYDSIPRLS